MKPLPAACLRRCLVIGFTAVSLIGCAAVPPQTTSLIARPQGRIETVVEGNGPTVLMIASLGRPMSDFDELSSRLVRAGWRTVRYNASGIGQSTGPMTGVSIRELAADAAAVIDATGQRPHAVLGHAFGQRVARMLATQHPDLVDRVVLLAAGGRAPMLPGAYEALQDCFRPELSSTAHLEAVRRAYFAPGNDASVWREGWYPATAQMQAAATQASPTEQWWGAGKARLLIIQGMQDAVASPENGRMIRKEFGDRARLVEIDRAGHALLPEQPQQLAEEVIAFLRAAGLGRGWRQSNPSEGSTTGDSARVGLSHSPRRYGLLDEQEKPDAENVALITAANRKAAEWMNSHE